MTMENRMKPLCIYHDKCADGFTSAWGVYKALGDEVEFFGGVHQNPPPDVKGRDVIMVDFSYKRPVIDEIAASAHSVLILDHHKTAEADLADFTGLPVFSSVREEWERSKLSDPSARKVNALFDMTRSGALITWEFFHPGKDVPNLVQYVSDRDLWQFRLPASREVNAFIFAHGYEFKNWDYLDAMMRDHMGVQNVADMGGAIEKKHHKDVAELTEAFKRRMTIGGHEVWCANIPYTMTSDAGHLMAKGEPFAACYWDTPEGRVFSLRSTDEGLDVSEIAKQYGGGGHRNASGFRLPHGQNP
jgi:uncharacterized protein